jgi:hypothetical protein
MDSVDVGNAGSIWERLKPQVDTSDSLLIIQICDNVSGWLEKDAWEWLHKHVPSS